MGMITSYTTELINACYNVHTYLIILGNTYTDYITNDQCGLHAM